MADEDSFAAGGGDTSTLAPGKHRGPRFSWNTQFEATFFASLVDSVQLGLREGSTFKPEAWDRALAALISQHNAYANKGHLINKSDNARKKFRLWRGLREDPEFQYNRATRMVTATEEAWKRHIEVGICISIPCSVFTHHSPFWPLARTPFPIPQGPSIRARRLL